MAAAFDAYQQRYGPMADYVSVRQRITVEDVVQELLDLLVEQLEVERWEDNFGGDNASDVGDGEDTAQQPSTTSKTKTTAAPLVRTPLTCGGSFTLTNKKGCRYIEYKKEQVCVDDLQSTYVSMLRGGGDEIAP